MEREKVVCLFSGGIDSPVACVLAAKRFEIIPLHFSSYPYTGREMIELTIDSLKKVMKVTKFEKAVIYPWAEIMSAIIEKLDRKEFTCLVCKKSMLKVAELVCELEGAGGIVTGESLGQKASQTLSNMTAISRGIKFPILRPLLGLDKLEIEKISKEFGIWQERHAGGCKAVPNRPRTRSNAIEVDELFNQLKLAELILKNFGRVKEIRTFKEDLSTLFAG
jgi:thiamine biosynthesis protein ThiI